jgi:hypothetical protein
LRRFTVFAVLLGALSSFACATWDYAPPPPGPPEAPGGPIDDSYFYDQLSPYGDWVEAPTYGWVWSPLGVAVEWRPYTLGHWVYTDDEGWLWVSDEEWGWAAYHYGRWYSNAGRWFWVPGRDWAPAWVAWRTGGGYIGWAPLPPQATFVAEVGLGIAAAALDSLLEPRAYCFVEERHFTEDRIWNRVVPVRQNLTIVNTTTNITNYNVVRNRVVNRSVAVEGVEHALGHAVPRTRSVENPSVAGPHRAQVQGNEVKVFRPAIAPPSPERKPPSAVVRAQTAGTSAEAVALFCYQVKKWIGAFAAALGGLDTLVFAGGIGENAPTIRARICDGLDFLGIEFEEGKNVANAAVISAEASRVTVRVMHTDEEWMIAKTVCRVLGLTIGKENYAANGKD